MATSTARAIGALRKEQARAGVAALLCWCGILAGYVVAALADFGSLDPTIGPEGAEVWPTSLVALTALLLLAELIALALAVEHMILSSDVVQRAETAWLRGLRSAAAVLALAVALTVGRWDLNVADAHAWATAIAAVGGLLLVLLELTPGIELLRPRGRSGPDESQAPQSPVPAAAPARQPEDGRRIRAIAASGGGIRAASFVLGGHQAVQAKAPDLGMDAAGAEPHLFAVSGGSYIAAALAMCRSFGPETGSPFPAPRSWREAYRPGSPELDRLRRHTRYLFEPRARTRDGLLSLLSGAMVNLFVAGSALLVVVWVSSQLVSMLGLTKIDPSYWKNHDAVTDFRIDANLGNFELWGLVPALAVGLAVVLTLLGWLGAAWYDQDARADEPSRRGKWLVGWSAAGRPVALGLALGWLVLVLGLPAAATGVAEAATQNQPTATVARALTTLGLVTPEMCSSAFRQDVEETTHQLAGATSTGVERTANAGACGAEVEISSTNTIDEHTDYAGLEEFAGLSRGTRVAGLGALLLAVLAMLRWASTSLTVTEGSRFARIRARLAVWIPLLVTLGIAAYLALLGCQRMLLSGTATAQVVTWVALGAGVVAYFVNANMTTLHNFYRARLSDAFAVSVQDGEAKPLPDEVVYRFSNLPAESVVAANRLREAMGDCERVAEKVGVPELGDAQERAASPDDLKALRSAAEAATEASVAAGLEDSSRSLAALTGAARRSGDKVTAELRDRYHAARAAVTSALDESAPERSEARRRYPVRLHIVATLNTQAPNESPAMRGGFPMVFGPERVQVFRGRDDDSAPPMRQYEDFAGPGRVSIMAAVAISGAAVSPLMGRNAGRAAPFRFLLALFNVRLGTWVLNPAHTPQPGSSVGLSGDRLGKLPVLWMTSRPGAGQVLKEAVGSSSADGRWVYVSDGGHLDNTGLVEAVRHTRDQGVGGKVLCIDASNDAPKSWKAVGDAVSVVRADLGLALVRDGRPMPPWARLYQVGSDTADPTPAIEVLVVKAVRVDEPSTETPDPEWWRSLPADVQAFHTLHGDFPRASTARQKFGDLEFEAYRQLGYVATTIALERAGWLTRETRSGLSSRATP